MGNALDRKAAIAAYKERKVEAGIYAIRCPATGQTWVGQAPDLSTIRNRIWFTLRMGSHRNRVLQEAWAAHGDSFAFEVLERLDEELPAYLKGDALKERAAHWASTLDAPAV